MRRTTSTRRLEKLSFCVCTAELDTFSFSKRQAVWKFDARRLIASSKAFGAYSSTASLWKAARAGFLVLAVPRFRLQPRSCGTRRGVATVSSDLSPASGRWLDASVATPIPEQVGDALVGKSFNTFGDLRQAIFEQIGNNPALNGGFTPRNIGQMQDGYAPISPPEYVNESGAFSNSFNIHHATPIESGGAAYDLSNLQIVSPKVHSIYTTGQTEENVVKQNLAKPQLLEILDRFTRAKAYGLSQSERDEVFLSFCAGCPDPMRAWRLITDCMEPMTDDELVERALAMPIHLMADVPNSELPAKHPLRNLSS